jgi:hypothetical protein
MQHRSHRILLPAIDSKCLQGMALMQGAKPCQAMLQLLKI